MKTIITLIFFILLSQCVQAQSQDKIDKETVRIPLYVSSMLMTDNHTSKQIFCGVEETTMFLSKKTVLIYTKKFNLDLKVVDRGLGANNSWLAVSNVADGTYYYITPFVTSKTEFGLIFQPVEKSLLRRFDLPVYTISSGNICEN